MNMFGVLGFTAGDIGNGEEYRKVDFAVIGGTYMIDIC
jgi:hypothetical protein